MKNFFINTCEMVTKLATALLACLIVAACGGYQVLRVDVLKPATLALPGHRHALLFLDRGVVHEGDTLFAAELETILGVTRDDLVNHFYLGLRDGLQWSATTVNIERATSARVLVADTCLPPPMTREEIETVTRGREETLLLTVDHCKLRRFGRDSVDLGGNMLLRLHDVSTGAVLDSLSSDRLEATTELTADDYSGSIREFFYQKGWSHAGQLFPAWVPEERRIYMGHKLLKFGYYFLERDDVERAAGAWEVALWRGNGALAMRAAVNLAWLLERNGEFEAAEHLLEETLERAGRRSPPALAAYVRVRVEALEQRQADDEKLIKQLHGKF